MSQQKREPAYDKIRGIAILLVVLGHGIQYGYTNFDENMVFRMIYSFHMPLFMFVSGIVVPLGSKADFLWLKKKFFQLVLPFGAWILLPFLFNQNREWEAFAQKLVKIMQSPDQGGLWFLWVLFLNCCALYVGRVICKKTGERWEWLVLGTEWVLIFLFGKLIVSWFGIGSMGYYLLYYFAGYFVGKYKACFGLSQRAVKAMQLSGFLGYLLLVPMWHRTRMPVWLAGLEHKMPQAVMEIFWSGFKYMVAFCGIFMVWFVVGTIWQKGTLWLEKLGRYTLEIYALHYYFITMLPFQDNPIAVIMNGLISLLLSLGVAHAVERGVAKSILFGKR